MKKQYKTPRAFLLILVILVCMGCKRQGPADSSIEDPAIEQRWITVVGALMDQSPGDGNGGTVIYSVNKEQAKDPNTSISVFDDGFPVRSNRTARLQSAEDGTVLFNIAYAGDNGGEFSRYRVSGQNNFLQESQTVNISALAGTTPRWVKLFDGDQTGVAVNVAGIMANNSSNGPEPGADYRYHRGTGTVVRIDLQNPAVLSYQHFPLALSPEEEILGHTIFRLDAPVLNRAGDKLIIGTWMRKYSPNTNTVESNFERLHTKSLLLDYPSLENPRLITSSVANGDNSGYRSLFSFVATDGNVYQATNRDSDGSHILRINQNNEYDNAYVFNLNTALGLQGVYVDTWRYVRNGIAYILYTHANANGQGFVARVDLNSRTATLVADIEYDADLNFGQYQGFVVDGDEVYITVTPTGKDGHIYILNSASGAVQKGARLINKAGNHYIGAF